MAVSATLVAASGRALRVSLLTILIAGLWFSGSRSGWVTFPLVIAASIYLRATRIREIAIAIVCAAAVAVVPVVMSAFLNTVGLPELLPGKADTAARLTSIVGGLQLFADHPMFGAGLGAFRDQMIFMYSNQPLLIHSTAIWLLAEMGIVGFLIFTIPSVWLFLSEIT